jgi:hypothetical protein
MEKIEFQIIFLFFSGGFGELDRVNKFWEIYFIFVKSSNILSTLSDKFAIAFSFVWIS